jgi:hypothetical protein
VNEGTVLDGRYRIEEPIGSGDVTTVWRAYDEQLGRTIAVTAVQPEASDPEVEALLRDQAVAAARIRHPNIVTVFDVVDLDGRTHVIMEHVDGPSVEQLQQDRHDLGQDIAAAIEHGVASALAEAHAVGVVHGDVTPPNVLVTPDGTVKLTGFVTGVEPGGAGPDGDVLALTRLLDAFRTPAGDTDALAEVESEESKARQDLDRESAHPQDLIQTAPLGPFEGGESGDTEDLGALTRRGGSGTKRPARGIKPGLALGVIALVLAVVYMGTGGDEEEDPPDGQQVEVAASSDFDPFGDGEHPDRVPHLHDGEGDTTWTTQRYTTSDFGGLKPGVGAWFDLGEPRTITSVEIDIVTPGVSFAVYGFDDEPSPDMDDWGDPLAEVADGDEEVALDVGGAEHRYWLLWLTSLPEDGGRHRAEFTAIRFIE